VDFVCLNNNIGRLAGQKNSTLLQRPSESLSHYKRVYRQQLLGKEKCVACPSLPDFIKINPIK